MYFLMREKEKEKKEGEGKGRILIDDNIKNIREQSNSKNLCLSILNL